MNKQRYLAELQRLLIYMTAADRAETLRRYGILFDRAGPGGEDELIRRIGSPTNTSIRLSRNYAPGDIRDAFFPDGAPEAPAPEPVPKDAEDAEPDQPEGTEKTAGDASPDESGDTPAEDEPGLPAAPVHPIYDHSLVEEELPDLPDLELPDLPDLPEPPAPPEPEALPEEETAPSDGESEPAREPETPEEGPAPAGEEIVPPPEQDAPEGPAPIPGQDSPAEGETETGTEAETEASEEQPGPAEPEGPEAGEEPPAEARTDLPPEPSRPRFVSMPLDPDEYVPPPEPPMVTKRSMPLWVGIPLFILTLILVLPLAAVILALLPVMVLPGFLILAAAWLMSVGGLWCISYIADAVLLFGGAFLILGVALFVLYGGLWLDVIMVKLYIRLLVGMKHLFLGKKVRDYA